MSKKTERAETSTATPPAAAGAGRDGKGRFTAGNAGGPGNPFARKAAAYRRAMQETVTEKDIKDIACMLLFKSKSGDLAATKLLLEYSIGKPEAAVDPDRLDVEEFRLFDETIVDPAVIVRALQSLPADIAATLLRATWPTVGAGLARQMVGIDPLRPEQLQRLKKATEADEDDESWVEEADDREFERRLDEEMGWSEPAPAEEKVAQAAKEPATAADVVELLRPLMAQLASALIGNGANGDHAADRNGRNGERAADRNGRNGHREEPGRRQKGK